MAGSGPVLLLIHGIGDDSSTWGPLLDDLARDHTVVAPDLLGHGGSDKPRGDYSIGAYANGMRDLLSVLDIDRVTVIGHSLGGGVAMQFAYQFPQLVDRLILVGAGGFSYEEAAAICESAVGTIKSRVNRARTRLSKLLSSTMPSGRGFLHPARQGQAHCRFPARQGSSSCNLGTRSFFWRRMSEWPSRAHRNHEGGRR